MDLGDVEMLSASLVREYLARKRLAQTLTLLDKEQAVFSSCVRNRLQLVRELQIGRLVKRNKQLGSRLNTMLEVIVCFLLRHARKRKGKSGKVEEKNESDGCVVRNEGRSERNEGSEGIMESTGREISFRAGIINRKEQRDDEVQEHERDRIIGETGEERMEHISPNVHEITKDSGGDETHIVTEEVPETLGEKYISKVISNKIMCDIKNKEKRQNVKKFNKEERQGKLVNAEESSEGVGDVCGINVENMTQMKCESNLDTGEFIEDTKISKNCNHKTSLGPRTDYNDRDNSFVCELQTDEITLSSVSENDYPPRYSSTDLQELESPSHSLQALTLESTCTLADSGNIRKNSNYSDTEESQTDSDCSISSVVDLLKDGPDLSDSKCGITAEVFRKRNVTSVAVDIYPSLNEADDKTQRDSTHKKEAWGENDDKSELQDTERQNLEKPTKNILEEVQEKWARERSEETMDSDVSEENKKEAETSISEASLDVKASRTLHFLRAVTRLFLSWMGGLWWEIKPLL
ncbi:hypothetical protein Pmani_002323 [Petrolisthes manimaculis]|uniref:MINDY4 N-terminal dimerisation domain-containing protein n=1 Tax=Petrolisthes manimaculis TaxID=1843537 RepID=A0AAE1QKQ2_9EUCA|nr:hypothetical protein Pmani_002323 [Petrolisthes manimaculis]